jgi:hypothetical protein
MIDGGVWSGPLAALGAANGIASVAFTFSLW